MAGRWLPPRARADIMVRTLALLAAFTWFTMQSAASGDVTLAANAILMQFVTFSAFFLDGFATAAEVLVGRAIGARERSAFREAVVISSVWAGLFGLALGALILAGGGLFIDMLTVNETVRAGARDYLAWAALMPVVGVFCWQLDGIFTGATRSADMRDLALVSLAIFLAAWALLTPLLGNNGLWLSLVVLNVARGLTLASRYPALVRYVMPARSR